MRVAVVSAYYKESRAVLQRCLDSVKAQSHPSTHFLISDGHPQPFLDDLPVRHVKLGAAHADYGDTPRSIGSLLAIREGFDVIAYLDADNFFLPDHIKQTLDAAAATGKDFDVLTTRRFLVRPDGSRLPVVDETYQTHTDTSCFLILRGGFPLVHLWALVPRPLSVIGDRIFLRAILARGCRIGHVPRQSVGYQALWKNLYLALGEQPPEGAKEIRNEIEEAVRWWLALTEAESAEVTQTLGFDPRPLLDEIASAPAKPPSHP